jgi:hypothetical protein
MRLLAKRIELYNKTLWHAIKYAPCRALLGLIFF